MQVEVKVPQLSESVSEATLVACRKKAGEAVKRDENLIDVETDKVVLELPAPTDGALARLAQKDGGGGARRRGGRARPTAARGSGGVGGGYRVRGGWGRGRGWGRAAGQRRGGVAQGRPPRRKPPQ